MPMDITLWADIDRYGYGSGFSISIQTYSIAIARISKRKELLQLWGIKHITNL
jgi:hypothetical protein